MWNRHKPNTITNHVYFKTSNTSDPTQPAGVYTL